MQDKLNKNFFFNKKEKLSLIIFLSIFIIDFFTKLFFKIYNVRTNNGFVDIYYTTNKGSLFSLFSNFEYVNLIFIIFSFVALYFIFYLWKDEKYISKNIFYNKIFPLTIIFSGIFSNLVDRIFYGSVVDWINFHFYPIFNIADSAIVIGVIYLLIIFIKESLKK